MTDVDWLVTGERSKQVIVTAPGAVEVRDAVARLDAALDGFAGPVPGWFRRVERLGYWWYAVCIAIAVPIVLVTASAQLVVRLSAGLLAGFFLALVSGAAMSGLAHLQARGPGSRTPDESRRAVADVVRPGQGLDEQARSILAQDPSREAEVHDLTWRAAGIGTPNRARAIDELRYLWTLADPEAAEEARAEEAEIGRMIRQLKDDGTI